MCRTLCVRLVLAAAAGIALADVPVSTAETASVEPRFELADPGGSPFPSDRFMVPDPTQRTALRVELPRPNCAVQPSECDDLDILNTLDGFNLQPRLAIPFTGAIDPASVTSETVFLLDLGPDGRRVGIDQAVWDPATRTLAAEAGELLAEGSRYLLVVTDDVRDASGAAIGTAPFRRFLNFGQTKDAAEKAYRHQLLGALERLDEVGVPSDRVAAASVFTTMTATSALDKIRAQLDETTPAPAEFRLGTGGERTVFPLASVASIAFRRQVRTDPTLPQSFVTGTLALGATGLAALPGTAGAIETIAFGSYRSPDYRTARGVMPPVGTLSGSPEVQRINTVGFNLFLPAGPKPPAGWPVVIAGHGSGGNKDTAATPLRIAGTLARHALATIAINTVGAGGGQLGTLTVARIDGTAVTLPSNGRGVDANGDGVIATTGIGEGFLAPLGPNVIVLARDGLRQTVVDWMQLLRTIRAGVDVDGDSSRDLDPARISYFGNSLGGMLGTAFVAVEPTVRAAAFGVAGGPLVEVGRLNAAGPFRAIVGEILKSRTPLNATVDPVNPGNTTFPFDDGLPPRGLPTQVNQVPGAGAIQEHLDRIEWVGQSGDPVSYARHLERPVLFPFVQGDPVVRNATTGSLLRAGGLADRTIFFRGLDAYGPNLSNPAELHEFVFTSTPAGIGFAAATQEAIATFLASGGATTLDPDGGGPLFETPIAGPLP